MVKMIQLCTTKYSRYINNYNNCQREAIEGCEGCEWYVSETILNMFEFFEKNGFNTEIRR
jgi:hypothetical protein